MAQDQQISALKFGKANGAAFRITEFHLKNIRRQNFDNGSDLSGGKIHRGPVFKDSHDIQQLGGCVLHGGFITRNRTPNEEILHQDG